MSRYPSEDQQFAETPGERNERRREMVSRRTIDTLQTLIADLSAVLTDEGLDYSEDGLDRMRRRVANALPPTKCPDWLAPFRDPRIVS